jgi:CYTH domain-containing protein
MGAPKYALPEIERRWLVELSQLPARESLRQRLIEDLYVSGSRLRLRKVVEPGAEDVYKLCKKYEPDVITNLYLSACEYELLATLPGSRVRKARYSLPAGVIDVYQDPPLGFAIFEIEFENRPAAARYQPPAFVAREITGDAAYSGAALALWR